MENDDCDDYDDEADYDVYYYDDDYEEDYDWMPQPTIWQRIRTFVHNIYWRIRNKLTGELDDIPF